MAAWWPVVHGRLLELIPTLDAFTEATVLYDGPPANEKGAKQWAAVGSSSVDNSAGSYDQPDSPVDGMRDETGTVLCEFVEWSGDDDLPTQRAFVFALADDLEAAIRADQTLNVLPSTATCALSATVVPARAAGTTQRLIVNVSYTARS